MSAKPPSLTSDAIITDTSPSFHLALSTPHRQGTSTPEPLTSSQLLSQQLRTELTPPQMLSRAAARTTTSLVTKRGFQTTRARMSSPYHYPEGAYSNIPFNPRSKWFGVGYWTFMATGFFAPFGIAVYQTYKPQ
ncbi:elongator complex 1 [Fusarium coicis]|nr:elongator complex 1 [Fusarium coicis]